MICFIKQIQFGFRGWDILRGVLPPNVETTLTLNADGTYLLIQSYNEK